METYYTLRLEVGEALFQQTAGDASPLILGRHGKVVDFEGAAIMEQHGSAQNEACHFAIYKALDSCTLQRPSAIALAFTLEDFATETDE